MALSLILGEAKLTAEQMETKADVTLEKQGDGFAITSADAEPRKGLLGAIGLGRQEENGNVDECRAAPK